MRRLIDTLNSLGLTEYEARAFAHLYSVGELKAADVAELSGVPRPKVYGALDELVERGLVDKIPGRPTLYRAKPPGEVRGSLERDVRTRFDDDLSRVKKVSSEVRKMQRDQQERRRELLHLVSVGDPSINETRGLYDEAEREIAIATKALEYLPRIESDLTAASKRGIDIKVLFLSPDLLSDESRDVQETSAAELAKLGADMRYSLDSLPLRGSIIDSSRDYDEGAAIFVVEERGVPLQLRDAAVTRNPSLVAGMKRYFDLIWQHESGATPG